MTGAPRTSPMGETLDETAANVFIRYKFEIKVKKMLYRFGGLREKLYICGKYARYHGTDQRL
jgi:hypothetical protein